LWVCLIVCSLTPANILGILPFIFWALTVFISINYIVFVMRADNRGEGGILALTALNWGWSFVHTDRKEHRFFD